MWKKTTSVERRLLRVKRELADLDSDIGTLSRRVKRPDLTAPEPRLRTERQELRRRRRAGGVTEERMREEVRVVGERGEKIRDRRFADYLSGSFESARPLRHERSVQRNRAIFMLAFVLIVLFMFVYHFLM